MKVCAFCKNEVEISRDFSRRSTCSRCGQDLHICLNCRFYSETAHNRCREPKAEFQRVREKANFCDYFSFRDGGRPSSSDGSAQDARKKFEELFKKIG